MSGPYLTFAARRLGAAVVIAVLVSAITFVMLHVLRPESFLDPRPLPAELVDYLWNAFGHFDLGTSRQPPFRPVGDLILERLPADLSLFVGAAAFGVVAGVLGGVTCARQPQSLRAHLLGVAATLALCAPLAAISLRLTAATMLDAADKRCPPRSPPRCRSPAPTPRCSSATCCWSSRCSTSRACSATRPVPCPTATSRSCRDGARRCGAGGRREPARGPHAGVARSARTRAVGEAARRPWRASEDRFSGRKAAVTGR